MMVFLLIEGAQIYIFIVQLCSFEIFPLDSELLNISFGSHLLSC